MAKNEKVYSRVKEAEDIIKQLCIKQPDVLWCVRPDNIAVLGIENKERSEKNKVLAKIKSLKGCEKAILQENNIPTRYVIELYYSDWNVWKSCQKQWILFHELLHIHSEIGKTISHDSEDFKILLDKVGVNWTTSNDLPDLINGDVQFNLELRPSLEIEDEEGGETDNIDDAEQNEENKKKKKKIIEKKEVATEKDKSEVPVDKTEGDTKLF